jgi:Cytochrome P450
MIHALEALMPYYTNKPVLSVPSLKNHCDFHSVCPEGSQEWYHQAELCSAANIYRQGYVHTCEPNFWPKDVLNSVKSKTVIAHSAYAYHMSEQYFEDPMSFKPERWLDPNARELESRLVSFSRGSRGCLGIKSVNKSSSFVAIPRLWAPQTFLICT